MIRCYLALGSNLASPARQLILAIKKIKQIPDTVVMTIAPFYKNPAWGRNAQPDFINTVIEVNTRLTPLMLLNYCHQIEKNQGRVRNVKWGSRIIDIDILLFGNITIASPKLTIPHPHMAVRDFVLKPLKMIAINLEDVYPCHRKNLSIPICLTKTHATI